MATKTHPKDVPHVDEIDYNNFYDDEGIEKKFNLKKHKSCDYYGHYVNCQWFIIESKSRGKVREALQQIANTIRSIPNVKLDFIFVVADKLDKRDAKEYETLKVESLPYRILVNKSTKKPVFDKITKNQVFVIQRPTMRTVNDYFHQKKLGEY